MGGETINYILELRSYSFDQVIFVVWIKFYTFGKHFSFFSLDVWLWLDMLIYIVFSGNL